MVGEIREYQRDTGRYRTLGEQYNNPGNIKQLSSGIWPGQTGIGWDASNRTSYKVFESVEAGLAAQTYLIERYVYQRGHQSFSQIINTYAPEFENDTAGYIRQVTGRVDTLARSLGYTGPTISGSTNLRHLLDGTGEFAGLSQEQRDMVLAATVKAMNEVEIGRADSDRIAPLQTVYSAVHEHYRGRYGGFDGYSRARGADPGRREPSARPADGSPTTITEDPSAPWRQPTESDVDDTMEDMFRGFVMLLLSALFGRERVQEMFGEDPRGAPAPETPAQITQGAEALTAALTGKIAMDGITTSDGYSQAELQTIRDRLSAAGMDFGATQGVNFDGQGGATPDAADIAALTQSVQGFTPPAR